jgi:acyl-CoA reductase-like NAD-dependent aldehyde dehydrogenase
MRIARKEIFGPIASVIPFETIDEAISIANVTIYCLAFADLAVTALPTNDSTKTRGTNRSNWTNVYTNFPVLISLSAISTFTPGASRPWQLPSSN